VIRLIEKVTTTFSLFCCKNINSLLFVLQFAVIVILLVFSGRFFPAKILVNVFATRRSVIFVFVHKAASLQNNSSENLASFGSLVVVVLY